MSVDGPLSEGLGDELRGDGGGSGSGGDGGIRDGEEESEDGVECFGAQRRSGGQEIVGI